MVIGASDGLTVGLTLGSTVKQLNAALPTSLPSVVFTLVLHSPKLIGLFDPNTQVSTPEMKTAVTDAQLK
jgi:hypothetical protein